MGSRKTVEMTFQQSRNRDTDIEDECMDTKEGMGGGVKSGDWD